MSFVAGGSDKSLIGGSWLTEANPVVWRIFDTEGKSPSIIVVLSELYVAASPDRGVMGLLLSTGVEVKILG
jgi:hypothetical protein